MSAQRKKAKMRQKRPMGGGVSKREAHQLTARAKPFSSGEDLIISDPVGAELLKTSVLSKDRLTFDGYFLRWHGADAATYTAFSGLADESARESEKDCGPTPQGLFAIDPTKIQPPPAGEEDAWGDQRVRLEPYAATVERMRTCFKAIRTGMYIHGGKSLGTIGCIELNDDAEEGAFFEKLAKYGRKIELEVKYTGERETKYEEPSCPT